MQYIVLILPLILAFMDFIWDGRDKSKKGIRQITFAGWVYIVLTLLLTWGIWNGIQKDKIKDAEMQKISRHSDSIGIVNNTLEKVNNSLLIRSVNNTDTIKNQNIATKIEVSRQDNELNSPFLTIKYSKKLPFPNPAAGYSNETQLQFNVNLSNNTTSEAFSFNTMVYYIGVDKKGAYFYSAAAENNSPHSYNFPANNSQFYMGQFYTESCKTGYIYFKATYKNSSKKTFTLNRIYKTIYDTFSVIEAKGAELNTVQHYLQTSKIW